MIAATFAISILFAIYLVKIMRTICCGSSTPKVLSKCGEIKGSRLKSQGGETIYSFRGIPYAKPPTGNLRFKKSEPFGSWRGVWNGKKESKKSHQPNVLRPEQLFLSEGGEDCLYLNVYSKNTDVSAEQPVIVFLHGGAFVVGSGEAMLYGPQVLLDRDVVLVTVNYRLGVLGWLTLETEEAPGNLGLHDQHLALKWVQQNISEFGGDPSRVTLMGESAGSMSALLHHVSPLSKGLFHRVVALSGTPSSAFLHKDRRPRLYALEIAKALGCTTLEDMDQVLEFLQSRSANDVLKVATLFKDWDHAHPMPWTPCVDDHALQPIVPMLYREAVAAGRAANVPVIMGCCRDEGLILTAKFFKEEKRWRLLTSEWKVWAPLLLFNRERDEASNTDREAAQQILNYHFETQDSSLLEHTEENVKKYTEACGLSWFLSPMDRDSKLKAKHGGTVYTFILNSPPNFTLFDIFRLSLMKFGTMLSLRGLIGYNPYKKVYGVCHGDDICYLFPMAAPGFPPAVVSPAQKQTQINLLDMVHSFADKGVPKFQDESVDWRPISESSCDYLDVGPELRSARDPLLNQKLEFWSGIKEGQETRLVGGQLSSKPFSQLFRSPAVHRTS